jgi:anaerobic ribonucleoside-triphosphate reductase activating protein
MERSFLSRANVMVWCDPMKLKLGHRLQSLSATLHNGPGWRIGLWTQGCVHRCTENCLNPHLLNPEAGLEYDVDEVRKAIKAVEKCSHRPIEGVTVLGGEPFEQAAPVAALLTSLRIRGLSTMVYSGHTYEHLRRQGDPGIESLLAATDLLVDGPFLPSLYDGALAWRGSANQRLLCLSERYDSDLLEGSWQLQRKSFSIRVGNGGIAISGLQTRTAAVVAEGFLSGNSAPAE